MSHTELEDPSEVKTMAHTSTLESPTKESLRRPSVPASIPHLSYLNEAVGGSVRERWNGEALEIEEPPATRRKEFTDYPEGGFGWVVVACKSGAEVPAIHINPYRRISILVVRHLHAMFPLFGHLLCVGRRPGCALQARTRQVNDTECHRWYHRILDRTRLSFGESP